MTHLSPHPYDMMATWSEKGGISSASLIHAPPARVIPPNTHSCIILVQGFIADLRKAATELRRNSVYRCSQAAHVDSQIVRLQLLLKLLLSLFLSKQISSRS